MIKTKEDKKKEILKYLNNLAKNEDWFYSSTRKIYEKFEDSDFDKEDIDNILDELKRDRRTLKSTVKFQFHYPRSYKKEVKKRLKYYIQMPKFLLVVLAFYILLIFSVNQGLYGWLNKEFGLQTFQDYFIYGLIFWIIGVYLLSWIIEKILLFSEEKIPIIQQNKHILIPISFIAIVMIGIIGLYSVLSNKDIQIGHVISILTVSVLGGFGYLTYIKKKDDKSTK